MSKPQNIPQDVRSASWELGLLLLGPDLCDDEALNRITRAILAAKAEEREACAVEVVDYMNELAVANEEARGVLYATLGHTTNEGARRSDLIAVIRDDLSDAIRKRGEVNVSTARKSENQEA